MGKLKTNENAAHRHDQVEARCARRGNHEEPPHAQGEGSWPRPLSDGWGDVHDRTAKGFTHSMVVRLPSREDLNIYATHPGHVEVATKWVKPYAEDVLVMDIDELPESK